MASSNVEIINIALGYLKEERISALDGSTETARLAERYFAHARDRVFEEHIWNVCINRVQLAPLSTKPAFGFTSQFQLPSDPYCIRVVTVLDNSLTEIKNYSIEGRKLLCDESLINLIYVSRVNDPNLYSPMLVECIARRLAADLAFPITGSASQTSLHEDLYQRALAEARSLDATQGEKGVPYDNKNWLFNIF